MKEFFQNLMDELHLYGIRQTEFLTQEDIQKLISHLTFICEKQFGYIPIIKQQAEIKKQLIQDQDTGKYGLTYQNIHKWLSKIADPYWKSKLTEHELTPQPEPVTDERRDYWLNIWKETLAKIELTYQQGKGSGSRLKKSLDAIAPKPEQEIFFISNGEELIPIKADSHEEAQKIYNETFGV